MGNSRPRKDNVFLIAAMLLPLVVVAFFLLATALPRWLVPPPGHDLLFTVARLAAPAPPAHVDYELRDGRVVARVRSPRENERPVGRILYRYHHEDGAVRRVAFDTPDDAPGDGMTVAVPALSGAGVSDDPVAPDGYRLQRDDHGYPGLFGALLGIGDHGSGIALVRDGRRIPLTPPGDGRRHYDIRFIGWVVHDGA